MKFLKPIENKVAALNNIPKKVLLSVFSPFLIFQSGELVRLIWVVPKAEYSFPLVILMAILVNLFVTGVFAFLGFAFPTSRIIGNRFYRSANKNSLFYFYRILGVAYFKKVLLWAYWGKQQHRKKYFDGTRKGIENFAFQTKQSEFGHLVALLVITGIAFLMIYKGHYLMAFLTLLINVVANLYPVFLQRVHRVNIERIATRLGKSTLQT